ncbi:uncharacterized protein PpBr36_09331 [Pyricularia pennisetigena]|uniref:uncharacterized protein n=1 Tax=Pyricularia pennisetigena TaxID=1578925 RepID=UPI001152ED09|nr:uncharacterized protein PpBr36_09331 [Pyricularia pennisetigena]TLS22094.1 hypothetical protein PpBr36_09331 [Pyricularia pennisetigena]
MKASNLRNILNPLDQQHLNAEYTTVPPRTTTLAAAATTTTTTTTPAAVAAAVASRNALSNAAPRTLVGLNDSHPSTIAAAAATATATTPSSSCSVFPAPHRFPSREDRSLSPRILPQATQEWDRQRLLPAINGLGTPHPSPLVLPLPRDMAVQQQQQSPASSRSVSVTTPQARHPKQEFPQQQQQQQQQQKQKQLALPSASSPWSSTGHGATPRRLLSPFGGDIAAQGTPSPFSSNAMSQALDRQQPPASLAATSTNTASTSSIGSSVDSNNAAAAAANSAFPSTTTPRGRPPLYSRGFWIRDDQVREPVISVPLVGGGGGGVGLGLGVGVGAIECTVDLKQGSAAADAKRRRDARAAQRCRDRKRMHNLKTEQELARCQRRVAQLSHEVDQLRRRNKLLLDMMPAALREDAERAGSPVTSPFPADD